LISQTISHYGFVDKLGEGGSVHIGEDTKQANPSIRIVPIMTHAERIGVVLALAALAIHLALGLVLIPLLGPQQDEVLFVRGLLNPV
jgi:hypothetical protein